MCISCGCNKPNDDHGDKRNLTTQAFEQAAQAAGISTDDVYKNIQKASGSQSGGGGQR